MTDLSKIDFTRLTFTDWYGHTVKASMGPLGVELRRGKHYRFAYLRLGGSAWEYVGPSRWNDLEVAKAYTDRVDAFIAEESARLAAEPLKCNLSAGMTSCATCGVTDCQAPSSPVDCGRYVREKKPSPRPCTREFALAHPGESEYRCKSPDIIDDTWTMWNPMFGPGQFNDYKSLYYEFRTTAREPEKRLVTVEFDGKRWAGELVEQ